MSVLGWAGRGTIYKQYTLVPRSQPGLMLVLEGIYDGIYPWELFLSGEGAQKNAEKSKSVHTDGMHTLTRGFCRTMHDRIILADRKILDTKKEIEEEIARLPENAVRGPLDSIPEGVCNPVMPGYDYGVAGVGFLSPDDTVYNDDTEGIFAKTGLYYKLQAVDSSYFKDALFIGDSRTVGLCEYGALKGDACFLAKESINVYNVMDKELRFTDLEEDSWDRTVEDTLDEKQYGKVYVNLGVNELGIGTTYMYYEKYRELLEVIREYQPGAIIYIQGIMHVSERLSSSDSCRNNVVISQRNAAISTLANGHDIFYIDMNPYVCDENGDLIEDLSGDGIHLKASAYENWDRSLLENAVVIGKGRE